jgi:hypothetical protein
VIAPQPFSERSAGPVGLEFEELEWRYEAYRRRQATHLVHMMPREAIRPMVRSARAAGFGDVDTEPLEMLIGFCEVLLPLPPFSVWCQDLSEHPEEHLRDWGVAAEAPTAEAPATVEVRAFQFAGTPWWAQLKSFRDGSGWRGYIAFQEPASGRVHRTAMIFRESDPSDLRDRFIGFETASLEAFLRSTLP